MSERSERFEALWDAHYAEIVLYALRRLGDHDAASEAAADTFLVAWRRLETIPERPRQWLFGVARKVVANTRRSQQRHQALLARIEYTADSVPHDPADDPVSAVAAAFNRLSLPDREVLALVVWEELAPREAARALGIPTARFSVRLHRAKQRLRKELSATGHLEGVVAAPAPLPRDTVMERQ